MTDVSPVAICHWRTSRLGQTVLDQHFLAVAGEPNDGWRLAVGLYDSATGQRAAVRAGSLPIEDGAVIVPWPTR